MLKVRITYANKDELEQALEVFEKQFNVLQVSKVYEGRGKSQYSNVYVDLEVKK